MAAVSVDFPKNKCNFLHKNKLDIVRRVQFLTDRRPAPFEDFISRGSRHHCPMGQDILFRHHGATLRHRLVTEESQQSDICTEVDVSLRSRRRDSRHCVSGVVLFPPPRTHVLAYVLVTSITVREKKNAPLAAFASQLARTRADCGTVRGLTHADPQRFFDPRTDNESLFP